MRFLTINGTRCAGLGKEEVADLIKATSGGCALTFDTDAQVYINIYINMAGNPCL